MIKRLRVQCDFKFKSRVLSFVLKNKTFIYTVHETPKVMFFINLLSINLIYF